MRANNHPMWKVTFTVWLLMLAPACMAQNEYTAAEQPARQSGSFYAGDEQHVGKQHSLQLIDSIAGLPEKAGDFCKVYVKTMSNIGMQIRDLDTATKSFVEKFEAHFADYFIDAWTDHKKNCLPGSSAWSFFFSNPGARPWQAVLLGINAHINMDIWQSLVYNFILEEIRKYKKPLLATQSSIRKVYYEFFESMKEHNPYLKRVNFFSMGLARTFGNRLVYKWRRRNVNLAILYYKDPEKFKRKLAIITRKKQRIDERILRYRSS